MNLIAEWNLKRRLRSRKRKVYFKNLKQAKRALILYSYKNADEEQKIVQFARFLKEEGLAVDCLAFYGITGKNANKPKNEYGRIYYDKKDLTWLALPKITEIKKRIAEPYDLLVDFNLKEDFSLRLLSSLSRAKFKVGPNSSYSEEILDLSIRSENRELSYLIEQIQVYLKMINKA